jgi:hypothetical protein
MDDLAAAVETAASELPDGYTIQINVERGAGTVDLIHEDGDSVSIDGADMMLAEQVLEALRMAKAEQGLSNG